jgi:hypothetical protein
MLRFPIHSEAIIPVVRLAQAWIYDFSSCFFNGLNRLGNQEKHFKHKVGLSGFLLGSSNFTFGALSRTLVG